MRRHRAGEGWGQGRKGEGETPVGPASSRRRRPFARPPPRRCPATAARAPSANSAAVRYKIGRWATPTPSAVERTAIAFRVDGRDNMSRGGVGASSYGMYQHVHQQSFQVSCDFVPSPHLVPPAPTDRPTTAHLYIFCDRSIAARHVSRAPLINKSILFIRRVRRSALGRRATIARPLSSPTKRALSSRCI